ncbi:MAG: NlpC/P60 family protein [Actinomycetes bacterium]
MLRKRGTHALAVLATAIAVVAVVPSVGQAAPNLTIAQAQQRVASLQEEAAAAAERSNAAQVRVDETTTELARVQHQLKRQSAQVASLDAAMAQYAAALYTTGGMDPTLQVMLADNPTDFLSQAGALDQVARTQNSAFRAAQVARQSLAQTQAVVDQKLVKLRELKAQAAKEMATANDKLQQAQQVLSSLKAEQRQRLAALAAQRAAAAQRSSRNALATVPAPAPVASSSGGSAGAVNGRAGIAVAYAQAQLGKPYVFAAAGPSAFDCSGLVMAAWGQAGVYLPHSASVQYAVTSRVSLSDIQPGDLVFFYSGIEHVGMYVGGGIFVHAANPTDGVVADSLFSSYWQSVYMGAGRV